MLGSGELGARLGAQFETQLGTDWGLGTRDSAWLGSGFSSTHLLHLVLGIGSAWKPGPARGSGLGSGLCARLGSEPSLAHLGSENIMKEH